MILIDEAVLDLFRGPGQCEWCSEGCVTREPHHYWIKRGHGGGSRLDHPWNLVALGGAFDCGCHGAAHEGRSPTRLELLGVAARREGVAAGVIERELYRLLRAPKGA